METYLSDNKGNRVSPHPNILHPVLTSGLKKVLTSADTNYTQTVTAGATYRIISTLTAASSADVIFVSVTGTAVTDANKEWAFPLGQAGVIKIPKNVTTLNLVSTVALAEVYLAQLDM